MAASYFTTTTHSNPLIPQQHHPFQPLQHNSHPPNYSTLTYYQTIKKVIQNMHIYDPPKIAENQNSIQECNANFASLRSTHSRYQTANLQKYVQHQHVCPEQELYNPQLSLNQSLQLQKNIKAKQKQGQECLSIQEQEEMMRRNEIIVKGGLIPCKKENYFLNAGGFTQEYQAKQSVMYEVLPNCRYPYIFVANLFLGMIACLSFVVNQNTIWIIFAGVAIIYLLVVYFSKIREDVFAMRKKDDLKKLVSRIKKRSGYFLFSIECFHYDPKGKKKIVTLNKTQVFSPSKSADESFDPQSMELGTSFAEININKQFCFDDKDSQEHFIAAFNDFVSRNSKDLHQKYHYSFEIQSSNQANGLFIIDERPSVKVLFIMFALVGVSFLFTLLIQCKTTRLKAKILKKLTF